MLVSPALFFYVRPTITVVDLAMKRLEAHALELGL
jgi:hypothetical protein